MEQIVDVGYRPVNMVGLRMVREKKLGYGKAIVSTEDAIALVKEIYQDSYREMVVVIGLDSCSLPTVVHVVAVGGPDQSLAPIGNIFKPLLLSNATQFILLHNHPGGSLLPSGPDRVLTEQVGEVGTILGVRMLDHIILSGDGSGFYSFKQHGTL